MHALEQIFHFCNFVLTHYSRYSNVVFTLNFWPKNDGEKWSRKNYFEIPPCGKMVIFITEFVILGPFMKHGKIVSRMEGFQNKFFRPLFTIIFLPKIVFLDTDSILRVKTTVEEQSFSVHVKQTLYRKGGLVI